MIMRIIQRAGRLLFLVLVLSVVLSIVAQQLLGRAWGWNMVSGRSMLPTLTPGDYIFVIPYFADRQAPLTVGEVVAFRDSKGRGTIHRVSARTEVGYVTKGDNNLTTDQASGQNVVPPSKVDGLALTIDDHLLRIPLIGALVLSVKTPETRLPLVLVALSILVLLLLTVVLWQTDRGAVAPRRRPRIEPVHRTVLTYVAVVLLGSLAMVSAMVRASSTIDFFYGVSGGVGGAAATSGGASMGVLPVGGSDSRRLYVTNTYPVSMLLAFLYRSDALHFSSDYLVLAPGQNAEVLVQVEGKEGDQGQHVVPVTLAILPRLLPDVWLYRLAKIHELLAMTAVSLVPMLLLSVPAAVVERYYRRRSSRADRVQWLRRRRLA